MKNKTAKTKNDIHQILKERWSPRSFSKEVVTEKELKSILEAGSWSPSSYNMQPWRIVYGLKGSKTFDRIFDCLVEFNQSWSKNASILLLGCYKKTTPEGKDNPHALHDLGQFMAHATFQAQSMDIAVHQMAGIDADKAKKEFGFPEQYEVATAVALGYYGGDVKEQLNEKLQEQEFDEVRKRNPQEKFAFNGDFKSE